MRLLLYFMLPVVVFCKLEMGILRYSDIAVKTFHEQFTRTIFGNTNVTITVLCSNGTLQAFYEVVPPVCPMLNTTDKEKSGYRRFKDPEVCHGIAETFTILSKHFGTTGLYGFDISINSTGIINAVTIEFGDKPNYLTPKDYPLFVFYSIMCVVYSIYALVWLILCCCHWRCLLRIQFWIGGVILLGMLEKAMFVGEYDAVRRSGETTGSMLIAAEVISSLKRTLSRMLVIIVSLGFGIIKPRLGSALHKVTLVGVAFFAVSCADGVGRTNKPYSERVTMVLRLLLSITDAIIFLWIFYSLVKTISLLTIRKNIVKLTLYRHFRNVLIFSVLASLTFMVAIYIENNFFSNDCNLENALAVEWWEDAFWSFLFSIILFAIIILWRPSANNQRYAYSPLQDIDDDDADQLTECTNEGLGVSKIKRNENDNVKKSTNNEDDDLKWVEENIPKSIIDSALSNLVESDEEINQKKLEISKML